MRLATRRTEPVVYSLPTSTNTNTRKGMPESCMLCDEGRCCGQARLNAVSVRITGRLEGGIGNHWRLAGVDDRAAVWRSHVEREQRNQTG